MKIDINGKRNITLDFNAPRKFKLTKDGAEIPYIRTGKNSFRLTKDVDGSVELEEVIEKPRYMKPFNLQAPQMAFISSEDVGRLNEAVQQMSLVNPEDVMAINNAAQKIDSVQMYIAEKQQQIEATQNYIDQQQQILNDSALNLQALETNNNQRLDSAETSIYSLASDLDIVKNATIENTYALDSIREQELITQASLETKADKTDVEKIKEELEEYKDDNESFKNALSNYSGGLASDSPVPEGGKDGQILTKITDESGVYGWKDKTPVIVKSKTIPTASEKYKGEVYQYVGETGDYTHGYIYECQQNGTSYEWVRLDVQPNHSAEIESLTTRVGNLETGKQDKLTQTQMDAVNSGANQSNIAQITTNQTNINTINNKIPAQASSSNQLADKDFVNSSISTNTANFIGTFASISDLEAYSGTITNNDYAFVVNRVVTDSGNDCATFTALNAYDKTLLSNFDYAWVVNGSNFDLYRFDIVNQVWELRASNIEKSSVTLNSAYNRYKAVVNSGTTWTYEYTLNNSSFTASQWQAINSGITADSIAEFEAKGALLDYTGNTLTLEDSDGNALSSVTIQSSPDLDGKSITKNSSQELQTIGVINQNDTTTAIKTWTGTKAQYDAIVTKNASTEYFCTDSGELYLGDVKIGSGAGGLEIGDIGIAPLGIDELENKRRYLNGQVISQAQFVEFTAMLKSRVSVYPNLATDEVNWQAEVTNSDLGQCGQFVIDDDAGTIRLPKVVNIQGLMDLTSLGTTTEAGLPNITGTSNFAATGSSFSGSGAFTKSVTGTAIAGTATGTYYKPYFDASDSNSIYGNSTTVQPESVRYPYFIQVATGVETSVDVSREIELNNPFSLLDYKYSEYELSNASWLLSNGQFNSGATYPAVYDLLLQIYNGTVTKAGVSVKLSTEAYADTDFVLNTSDTSFRLPIKVLMAGSKRVAGNGMTLGLTDGTNTAGLFNTGSYDTLGSQIDAYGKNTGYSTSGTGLRNSNSIGITTDETKSGIETSANGLYLYFYVGETVQDANIIAAASVLTDVANLKNVVANISFIPDYSAGISVNATSYTAPKAGIVLINCVHVDHNSNNVSINGVQIYNFSMSGSYANGAMTPFETPVSAGDVINSKRNIWKFYTYKGA